MVDENGIRVTKNCKEVHKFNVHGFDCYIVSCRMNNAWLAYVDITDFPEIQDSNYEFYDSVLPFHRGCTFCNWTRGISNVTFQEDRFLIGCDWSHGTYMYGAEDAELNDVEKNIREVVDRIPELQLKATIRGNNI